MWHDIIEMACPKCEQLKLKMFVALDEAGANNEHYVMTKCTSCDYEQVYIPELVNYARSISMLV